MERFIKIKENVSLQALSKNLTDNRIIILRESRTTHTIQIQILEKLSTKSIREAFRPFTVEKIYHEFPYPIRSESFIHSTISGLKRMIRFQT